MQDSQLKSLSYLESFRPLTSAAWHASSQDSNIITPISNPIRRAPSTFGSTSVLYVAGQIRPPLLPLAKGHLEPTTPYPL